MAMAPWPAHEWLAMKAFHCTHCQNLVFFENDRCLKCGYPLAYLADQSMMVALEQGQDGLWRAASSDDQSRTYSLCANHSPRSPTYCSTAVCAPAFTGT
jgi:hypothetical protein